MDIPLIDNKEVKLLPSVRFGITFMWFYGAVCFYTLRSSFGVSIVCMTVDPVENGTTESNTTSAQYCSELTQNGSDTIIETGEFEWDRTTRGLVNSAFYLGYGITNVVGGIMAQHLGAKWVQFGALLLASTAAILSPVMSEASPWALYVARVTMGLGCGPFIPSMRNIISNWSPIHEKAALYAIFTSGFSIGSVIAFSMSGFICSKLGWEWTFYIPAMFPLSYLLILAFLGKNNPEEFTCISANEKKFITDERTQVTSNELAVPWKAIFTSVPVWAAFITNFMTNWGVYTMLTSGAQYMADVLKFDIEANGLYNALPSLCKWISLITFGFVFDLIIRKHWLSTLNARKLSMTLSMLGPAAILAGLGFMTCDTREAAVALLCISEIFTGCNAGGLTVNIMEIAPRFVPALGGVYNSFATLSGFISPIVAGALTPNGTREEWQIVFFIGVAFYVVGWLVYVLFADADVQDWAKLPSETDAMEIDVTITRRKSEIFKDHVMCTSYGVINDTFDITSTHMETRTKL